MNTKEIKRLLEKYYNAESSEEEELIIRNFFRGGHIPEELRSDREIFAYYEEMSGIREPSGNLEGRIIAAIAGSEQKIGSPFRKRILISLSAVAAILLILAGSYFFLARESGPGDTFTDPRIAYTETMKILYDVSARMNRGTMALATVGRMEEITAKSLDELSRPANVIGETLAPLDQLGQALEAFGKISNE